MGFRGSDTVLAMRFGFGRNWADFARVVDDERILEAEGSLKQMLDVEDLSGLRFLDIGSGSGLFSLAAARLGAAQIHSFDFDADSVRTTETLKSRYFSDAPHWTVERGSVLDQSYIESLGKWDVVYAWGVLHHTGDMWTAVTNAASAVAPNGKFFVSLYTDQGVRSRMWRVVKRVYNRLPTALRAPYVVLVMLPFEVRALAGSALRRDPKRYVRLWTEYKGMRGMSRWHDFVDWVGGYPFDVAAPRRVVEFLGPRGFELERLALASGWGCNEYVLRRNGQATAS